MRGNPDRCPTHPGQYLREEGIPGGGKSKAEIARLLGVSRKRLNDILAERKPVTPEVAVRLARLFGGAPEIWSGLQNDHDIWHACRTVDVSDMPTLTAPGNLGKGRVDGVAIAALPKADDIPERRARHAT